MAEYKSIKNWAEDDRPREKMIINGVQSLSNSELLAILIGSGYKNKSALELAKEILDANNNSFNDVAKLTIDDLKNFKGIGEAKAINIFAALEIGRRRKSTSGNEKTVSSPEDVFNYMHNLIGDIQYEEFWVIFLNKKNKILSSKKISQGGITETIVDLRLILKYALSKLAINIIICHNHPSGICVPSQEDMNLTTKVKNAAEMVDIKLLDHVIICNEQFYSFTKNDLL